MGEFRAMKLPREFLRAFHETPDQNIIKDNISDMNERYERLKMKSVVFANKLSDIADRLQRYQECLDGTNRWLGEAQKTMSTVLREPIGATPSDIHRQIDQLKVF